MATDLTPEQKAADARAEKVGFGIAAAIIAALLVGFLTMGVAGVGLVAVGIVPVIYLLLIVMTNGG
ncbi:hypothetical protein [Aliiroseovarius subalbicans]|uniref:hypothetical protein n=1 Tax=Aliiroseovarius subalbicans TaxID=2925840 RepID=UPI001F5A630E|nr:hypothetical protein [Aliiroseovarius subalbicans]MCI2399308.1 hypothetical protein [Aliiroseovarius subalbicans]